MKDLMVYEVQEKRVINRVGTIVSKEILRNQGK